mgnify:CR=1 FL=1
MKVLTLHVCMPLSIIYEKETLSVVYVLSFLGTLVL